MKKRFDTKRPSTRMVLTILIVAAILVFAGSGCSRWSRPSVRESQLRIQNMVQGNSQQILNESARIEDLATAVIDLQQRQAKLEEQVKSVEGETINLRQKMIMMLTELKNELARIASGASR